jgi:CheY-like chemotaxis protein
LINTTTIFLAEDDSEDRALFTAALKSTTLNTQLTLFENGEQLLHFLKVSDQKPDIIFLDLKMPGLNGKECLKQIREQQTLNEIPIVIFTCTEYIDDIHETYKHGANLYVPKNVFIKNSTEALKMIVDSTLNKTIMSPTKENYVLGGNISSFSWNSRSFS